MVFVVMVFAEPEVFIDQIGFFQIHQMLSYSHSNHNALQEGGSLLFQDSIEDSPDKKERTGEKFHSICKLLGTGPGLLP